MRKWEAIFTDADRALVKKAGFGKKLPFGKKPALLIIDVNRAFVGSQPKPILESVEEYGTSCGESGWKSIESIQKLLSACREKGITIIYTTTDPQAHFSWGTTKFGLFSKKEATGWEIAEQIKPQPGDIVLKKMKPSAFFGTPLASVLRNLNIDCLLVAGTTTSGCVRASVVDACSYSYHSFVVEECVFDRFELSHLVNLWDMNAKYADVISLNEALGLVKRLKKPA